MRREYLEAYRDSLLADTGGPNLSAQSAARLLAAEQHCLSVEQVRVRVRVRVRIRVRVSVRVRVTVTVTWLGLGLPGYLTLVRWPPLHASPWWASAPRPQVYRGAMAGAGRPLSSVISITLK